MLDVFADIHARTGATIVFVTHDQSEALALADRIVVLDRGEVQQAGTPQAIYAEPANAMVAGFVGRGTLVDAMVDKGVATMGDKRFAVRGAGQGAAKLLVRPEAVRLADGGIAATVSRTRYTGATYETTLTLASGDVLRADLPERLDAGAMVGVAVTDAWIVPA
jgi:iron(III) transport system ATP-binding protein